MAVAEARAAWQRTVNRCLVQEDAKRAPKLACCPSASSSVREVDVGPRSAPDAQDSPSVGFLPFSRNTSYSNISPSSRWWLQHQPSYKQQKGLTGEQINSEQSEMKISQSGVGSAVKCPEVEREDNGPFADDLSNADSFVSSDVRTSSNPNLRKDIGSEKLESQPICKGSLFEPTNISTDSCIVSKKTEELFPYSQSSWIGNEKTEPWWRIADEEELALFVAQRSFGLVENCDLPQPQNSNVKRQAFVDLCSANHEKTGTSFIESKHPSYCIASEGERQKQCFPIDCYSESSTSTVTSLRDSTNQGALPRRSTAESESSKAELLEALRHSQTRAREAENAVKQAYEEKEHVVKLVFRQASQLFAYKQWFQLLQLENLCYQIKNNKNQPISSLFPIAVPWMPQKPRKSRKNGQKGTARGKRGKKGRPRGDICKYAVVFALGLSLVGAGLFLGWTVGWMLPTF